MTDQNITPEPETAPSAETAPPADTAPSTENQQTPEQIRQQVIEAKGLTEFYAKRLTGSTREELEADADDLLAVFPPRPKAYFGDVGQGVRSSTTRTYATKDLNNFEFWLEHKSGILQAVKDGTFYEN